MKNAFLCISGSVLLMIPFTCLAKHQEITKSRTFHHEVMFPAQPASNANVILVASAANQTSIKEAFPICSTNLLVPTRKKDYWYTYQTRVEVRCRSDTTFVKNASLWGCVFVFLIYLQPKNSLCAREGERYNLRIF
jgi:hypothetical protein